MWPDWAIYWTLGKPTHILRQFFVKVSKSIIFLVKLFFANFYWHFAIFLVTLLLMLMPACCIITTLPKEKQISEADVSQKFFRLYLAIRFHMCFRCRPYMTRCKEGGRCCILAKGSSTLSLSLSSTHTLRLSHSPLLFYFWSISSKVHWPILQGRRSHTNTHLPSHYSISTAWKSLENRSS